VIKGLSNQHLKNDRGMGTAEFENKIVCGDSLKLLKQFDSNSIHLTVTSPPYGNAIDYDMHLRNLKSSKKEHFRGKTEVSLDVYLDKMKRIFSAVHTVTKDGGYCCIVIGNEIKNGELIALPSLLLTELLTVGWKFHEEIIWHKVTGGAKRFGITVQNPYPTYYRANIMHESILVLQKGDNHIRRFDIGKLDLNDFVKKEIANSVWHIAPVPPNYLAHPCPFPEEIPYRLIHLYSYPNDIVLDPFNGSGQTTKVAKYFGRRFIGFDIKTEYVELAMQRLNEQSDLRDKSLSLDESKFPIPRYERIDTWKQGEPLDEYKISVG
jgi:site-specific DNA-methyltransferase (adenine-specific)